MLAAQRCLAAVKPAGGDIQASPRRARAGDDPVPARFRLLGLSVPSSEIFGKPTARREGAGSACVLRRKDGASGAVRSCGPPLPLPWVASSAAGASETVAPRELRRGRGARTLWVAFPWPAVSHQVGRRRERAVASLGRAVEGSAGAVISGERESSRGRYVRGGGRNGQSRCL